jgi:hypothetical protein
VSNSSWLADALLGSPIPPPNWLDPRHIRDGWTSPRGGYYSYYIRPMHVSGRYIAEELRALSTCVNPPIVQGWAWCLALVGVAVTLLGLVQMRQPGPMSVWPILMILGPLPLWFVAVIVGGFFSHDIELHQGRLSVRRWTDVWLGLEGRSVGSPDTVHAALSCGNHLHLEGDEGDAVVSLAMWPSSSRLMLEERFDHWGIELEFPGQHHVHHPDHWNHGRHRIAHRVPEQGHHRRADGTR